MKFPNNVALAELFEVLTVGFPFCGFKIIVGIFLLQLNSSPHFFGEVLIVLGVVDLLINIINSISLLIKQKRIWDACLAGMLIRLLGRNADIGNAIDVMLSFILVAVMIGTGTIKQLSPFGLLVWNICVVINVLGAGLGRLSASLIKAQ